MGLILIVIGSIAGWKTGALHWKAYLLIALLALVPAGLTAIMWGRTPDVLTIAAAWLGAFAYLAVPFTLFAWLKRKRIENREGE